MYLSIFARAGSWLLLRLSSPCGEQGPLPRGCARASHCGGLPLQHRLWGMKASVVAAPGVLGIGSVVVKHGLSCSTAWGIFPDQGLNPCLQHWQAHSLPLSHRGSPGSVFIEVVEKMNEWEKVAVLTAFGIILTAWQPAWSLSNTDMFLLLTRRRTLNPSHNQGLTPQKGRRGIGVPTASSLSSTLSTSGFKEINWHSNCSGKSEKSQRLLDENVSRPVPCMRSVVRPKAQAEATPEGGKERCFHQGLTSPWC